MRLALLALLALSGAPAADDRLTLDLGGGVTLELVEIKAGKFTMGADERGERPPHEVTISKNFWMQTTEVTQAQWKAVLGTDPSEFKGADLPVENVSWEEAVEFTKRLTAKVQDQLKGRKAALPTEAEWEYACRAGTTTPWSWGGDEKSADLYCWHDGNSGQKTNPVGKKKPNPWGLFDMHGNLWEWVADRHAEEYPAGAATDPQGPDQGDNRVRRGGGWGQRPGVHQCTTREGNNPTYRCNYIGFRTAVR